MTHFNPYADTESSSVLSAKKFKYKEVLTSTSSNIPTKNMIELVVSE